ncbi:hypothetical protein AVEN_7582-1 [Araneus ventricosus]|uniref:Chitin-binding type-2 domain-containing protein n=1 Tax=Araneus ventricosus TaxID=182803 RepID=A0A4Y2RKN7_ARAVE|nr:hypothetical protein AVEN_7582-1 [Araneus ventricosus]
MAKIMICLLFAALCCQMAFAEFKCPNKSGYYADPEQCDLYYECRNGVPKEKLCKDGLVFNDKNPLYERCDFPFVVQCGKRQYLRKLRPYSLTHAH